MPHRAVVRSINFPITMTAPPQLPDLLIRKVCHHLQQSRIRSKEVLARISARDGGVFLPLSIYDFRHALKQDPVSVAAEQIIPLGSPDYFDDVPARTAKYGL